MVHFLVAWRPTGNRTPKGRNFRSGHYGFHSMEFLARAIFIPNSLIDNNPYRPRQPITQPSRLHIRQGVKAGHARQVTQGRSRSRQFEVEESSRHLTIYSSRHFRCIRHHPNNIHPCSIPKSFNAIAAAFAAT